MLLVTDIDWDTDGEDPIACNLPEAIVIVGENHETQEEIVSKLSDAFGWCVKSLNIDPVETKIVSPLFSMAVLDISP
jgi:hypothetical protein